MTTEVAEHIDPGSIRYQARRWLVRMDGDESLSVQEEQALQEWMRSSERNRQELQRLAAFWRQANKLTELLTHNSTWAFGEPRNGLSNGWHGASH